MFIALKPQKKAGFLKSLSFQLCNIFLLLSSLYILPGCGSDKDAGAWANFKPLSKIDKHIQGYYEASLGEAANSTNGNPAVYVDFSDGLVQAYKGNENVQIVPAIA